MQEEPHRHIGATLSANVGEVALSGTSLPKHTEAIQKQHRRWAKHGLTRPLCFSLGAPSSMLGSPRRSAKKSRRGFRQIISATETPFRKLNKICCQGPMFATISRFDFFLAIFFVIWGFLGGFSRKFISEPKMGGILWFQFAHSPILTFFLCGMQQWVAFIFRTQKWSRMSSSSTCGFSSIAWSVCSHYIPPFFPTNPDILYEFFCIHFSATSWNRTKGLYFPHLHFIIFYALNPTSLILRTFQARPNQSLGFIHFCLFRFQRIQLSTHKRRRTWQQLRPSLGLSASWVTSFWTLSAKVSAFCFCPLRISLRFWLKTCVKDLH